MTTEPICFRYDGSEEAKQALKWVNEKNKTNFVGFAYRTYTSDGKHYINIPTTHRLVTPAEFLRLVSEPQWKVGDECMIDEQHNLKTYKIEHITSDNVCMLNCLTIDKGYTIRHLSTLRPVRKSLREEIEYILSCRTVRETQIDEIISLIKQRKDEL